MTLTLGEIVENVCKLCEAEGYPYNEETCKDCEYNPNNKHETITFGYKSTSRGTVDEYQCSCCGCYIYFPAYDTYASEKIDYRYCPYCGRPVESEDDA